MTDFIVIIPARFASSRLPGKPLADLGGRPMILHVWDRARESGAARIVVATDDLKIRDVCRQFGVDAMMTSTRHASGTDRINEVAASLALADDAVIVNVQGDEPLMPPENIRQVAELAAQPGVDIATLHAPVTSLEEFLDPNVVKLVAAEDGRALYFSRAPIPWHRDAVVDAQGRQTAFAGALRHLGIYAYRTGALRRFATSSSCALEETEKLEQLRALWLGMNLHTAAAARAPLRGVDTPADLEALREILQTRS